MSKIGEYVIFKIGEKKAKSPFMIYSDFVSILRSENNGKQNHDELNQNQNMLFAVKVINSHVLMKYLLSLLNRIVYKFIISIIEQSKCFSDVMEKSF